MKKRNRIVGFCFALLMLLSFPGCGKGKASSEMSEGDAIKASAQLQFQKPEKGDEIVVINTSEGTIKVMLFPEIAPKAVENFVTRAKEGYYNGLRFYEILKGKTLSTGDPNGDGTGGESIYKDEDGRTVPFEDEYSTELWHFYGALSYINDGQENNNGSRFSIVQSSSVSEEMLTQMQQIGFPQEVIDRYREEGGAPWLDTKQVVFAQVYEGFYILNKIAETPADPNGVPKENVVITSMSVEEYK